MEGSEYLHDWHLTRIDTFWNTIAYQKKVFHINENEEAFLEILAGFVGTGINRNECAVVMASSDRLKSLEFKLTSHGLHVPNLISEERYLPVPAETILNRFMIDNIPSEELFISCISEILATPRNKNMPVRAYREMSSILLQQGQVDASLRLEQLWATYQDKEQLSLFCAYLAASGNPCQSLKSIGIYNCKVVSPASSISKIFYKDCVENSIATNAC